MGGHPMAGNSKLSMTKKKWEDLIYVCVFKWYGYGYGYGY